MATIYRPDTKWGPDLVSQVLHAPLPSNFFKYVGVTKDFISDVMYLPGDFGTICRPCKKWGPELISQVAHTPLPSNCFIYVGMTIECHQWHLQGGHVTLVQFIDHVQNEDQIWYLRFYTYYCLQILLEGSWELGREDKTNSLIMNHHCHTAWIQFSN